MTGPRTGGGPSVDELARLGEERDDLLAAIDALDREREAGLLDDDEYEALRDDYTGRAAAVLRSMEVGRAELPARRRLPVRTVLTVLTVAAVCAVVAGLVLADSSGSRLGGNITGDIEQTMRERLLDANLAVSEGSYDEAHEIADSILAEEPDNVGALVVRAEARLRRDEPVDALTDLDHALGLDPDNPRATFLRGVVLVRLPESDLQAEGLALLDRATELAPQDWLAWIERGAAYEQLTDDDATALDSYQRALDLDPPGPVAEVVQQSISRLEG